MKSTGRTLPKERLDSLRWPALIVVLAIHWVYAPSNVYGYLNAVVILLASLPATLTIAGLALARLALASLLPAHLAFAAYAFLAAEALAVLLFALHGGLVPRQGEPGFAGWLLARHASPVRRCLALVAAALMLTLVFRQTSSVAASAWALIVLVLRHAIPREERNASSQLPWARKRQFLASAALCAASILFSCAVLEVGARLLFDPPRQLLCMEALEVSGDYANRVSQDGEYEVRREGQEPMKVPYEYSEQGLRDREYGPKGEGEFRILLIGDSFTEGYGIAREETMGRVLERELNAGLDAPCFVVVNAGFQGYSAYQERGVLLDLGLSLEPDLVILQILPANDVYETIDKLGAAVYQHDMAWRAGVPQLEYHNLWPVQCQQWLHEHVRVYTRLCDATDQRNWVFALWNSLRFLPVCKHPEFDMCAGRPWWLEISHEGWTRDFQLAWDVFEGDVCEIRDDCIEHKAPLLAYALPTLACVSERRREANVDKYGVKDEEYDWDREIALVEDLLEAEGIPYFSMLEGIRAHPQVESLYYWDDGHFTAAGAEYAAHIIYDHLVNHEPLVRDTLARASAGAGAKATPDNALVKASLGGE